jgi:hypothetical protein
VRVTDVYVYVDETGDLDFSGNPRASAHFGLGSAVFRGPHGAALAAGLELRCRLEAEGLALPRGFHAKDDSHRTRDEVFGLIREQAPRFDVTLLDKERADLRVREASVTYRYKLAAFLHLKWLVPQVAPTEGSIFVIIGSLQTAGKREAVRNAVTDVCAQMDLPRARVVPCIWDAPSSWGIQIADYGLWAAQRELVGRQCTWFEPCVKPTLASVFHPWA